MPTKRAAAKPAKPKKVEKPKLTAKKPAAKPVAAKASTKAAPAKAPAVVKPSPKVTPMPVAKPAPVSATPVAQAIRKTAPSERIVVTATGVSSSQSGLAAGARAAPSDGEGDDGDSGSPEVVAVHGGDDGAHGVRCRAPLTALDLEADLAGGDLAALALLLDRQPAAVVVARRVRDPALELGVLRALAELVAAARAEARAGDPLGRQLQHDVARERVGVILRAEPGDQRLGVALDERAVERRR